MVRPPIQYVSSPARWRALLSPVRAEIAEALRCIGPCSIAELASIVDRPADALYRHIEQLEHAGFVVKAGLRKKGRHFEQLIDVTADDFQIDFADSTGREENRAIVETARTVLRTADRAVADSAAARELDLRPKSRNLSILYELSWLTPEAFQRVRLLCSEIKEIFVEGRRNRAGRLYLAVSVAVPVTRRRRTKERARAANLTTSPAQTRSKRELERTTGQSSARKNSAKPSGGNASKTAARSRRKLVAEKTPAMKPGRKPARSPRRPQSR